ncbi:hypothetical protein BU17DRAFT_16275, partial [Hysterangium stoloniferum]
ASAADNIHQIMQNITDLVSNAAVLRDEIQSEIQKRNITIENISDMLSAELAVVFEQLQTEFTEPLPENKTERYKQRERMVSITMIKVEDAFVICATTWDVSENDARAQFQSISLPVKQVVLGAGNVIDNHPELIEIILLTVAVLLLPESFLLRSILSLFGFGPYGPIKGSAAAWAQRIFFGGVVKSGSWFSFLQKAGM